MSSKEKPPWQAVAAWVAGLFGALWGAAFGVHVYATFDSAWTAWWGFPLFFTNLVVGGALGFLFIGTVVYALTGGARRS